MKLIDIRTSDGSRHFARLPKTAEWDALADHIGCFPGAEIISVVTEGVARPSIAFTYQGHRFSIIDQDGTFSFFVNDPQCADVTLYRMALHCEEILGSS